MFSILPSDSFLVAYDHQFLSNVQLHSCLFVAYRTHHFLVHVTNSLTQAIT